MNKKVLIPFLLFGFSLIVQLCFGQILDGENKLTITLKDKTTVTLYGAAVALSDAKSKEYYYLPCNLRLSKKKDGTPEFLFLKFTSEGKDGPNSASGALLHMLMVYGLTKEQEEELRGLLKVQVKDAVLRGAVDVDPDGENSIKVISATLTSKDMTRSLVLNAKAPTLPGSKIALAAMLDQKGAQLFAATLEKTRSITDLSLNLNYTYTVRVPAARGYIREDWSRVDSLWKKDSANYSKKDDWNVGKKIAGGIVGGLLGPIGAVIGFAASGNEEYYSYDEMRKIYKDLQEKKIVTLRFEENITDERIDKIREAFFQHFLNNFTDKDAKTVRPPDNSEKEEMPDIKTGNGYKFNRTFQQVIKEKKIQEFNLNYALAIKRPYQITENLASWYDGVKDNPKCVGVVNLNDPFFQHRDINVILDLEAEEMMGKEVNYVTVNIRKKRAQEGANDFQQDITFDRKFIEQSGNRTTVTYSKAQDDSPELYEYKVQWSLKGGNLFPPNDTTWQKGSWQGLTLAPPITPKTIRFEADADDLKEHGIKNVTLQIRYKKFNNEAETNIGINASSQNSNEKMIFLDRNAKGYAYRLVFTHKDLGVMATDWDAKVNTDYVYATIPKKLKEKDDSFINKLLEAGKVMTEVDANGNVPKNQQILDKFKKVIEVFDDKRK